MTTPVDATLSAPKPITSGGTAAISIRLVQKPASTNAAIQSPRVGAAAATTAATTNTVT